MDLPADLRRRAFVQWLRTGRWPKLQSIETKFNPWHDPENGRFTFAGTGRRYDSGGASASWGTPDSSKPGGSDRDRRGGSFSAGGDGSFGGGGASGSWDVGPSAETRRLPGNEFRQKRPSSTMSRAGAAVVRPQPETALNPTVGSSARKRTLPAIPTVATASSGAPRKIERRNGYVFTLDQDGKTREVTGEVSVNPEQSRSRTAQAQAGGIDRRATDDGGHYIARRLNGPTDSFNHFAQDANFNRSAYKKLENQWREAKRSGKSVSVRIVPEYSGNSERPSKISVWYRIDGVEHSREFPNEKQEAGGAK